MDGAWEACAGCSKAVDNSLNQRKVTIDCYWRKRNLSMEQINVKKAHEQVDHGWLQDGGDEDPVSTQIPYLVVKDGTEVK